MSDVIIFGGTTEGRLLAQECAEQQIRATICVVSDYGKQVLPDSLWLNVSNRAMSEDEMVTLIEKEGPKAVFDATHPYAAVVSEHVGAACRNTGVPYIRIAREETEKMVMKTLENEQASVLWMETVASAAEYLRTVEGTVFVTTGSKELGAFTVLPDYSDRLFVRVLPGSENLALCESYGICGKHVIGMQGPFSREMNAAMLRHTGARYLVTKEAGAAGGFMEKIEAAWECGVIPIVIGRPKKPEGISVEDGRRRLRELSGHAAGQQQGADRQQIGEEQQGADLQLEAEAQQGAVRQVGEEQQEADRQQNGKTRINLIGTGMGGAGQMTQEAVEVLQQSDVVLGAIRLVRGVENLVPDVRKEPLYLSRDILPWLKANEEYQMISVLYSGDTGFYSGAKTLLEDLKKADIGREFEVQVYPGISTVSYLCARLQTSWDDAYLVSAHGRKQDVPELLKCHDKIILLLGGDDSVKNLCRELEANGYSDVLVSVGERLSYPDEQIVTGTPAELGDYSFGSLVAVLLQKRQ